MYACTCACSVARIPQFVEFRSVTDCTKCLSLLANLHLAGRPLRVGRPADYKPPPPTLENYVAPAPLPPSMPPPPAPMPNPLSLHSPQQLASMPMMMSGMQGPMMGNAGQPMGMNAPMGMPMMPPMMNMPMMNMMMPGMFPPPVAPAVAMPGASQPLASPTASVISNANPPSRVVALRNMVTAEELLDDEEYGDIVEDVKEECKKYGDVEDVVIPRPPKDAGELEKLSEAQRNKQGIGRIFVVYTDIDSCKKAIKAIDGRMFNKRQVEALFFDEAKLKRQEFA